MKKARIFLLVTTVLGYIVFAQTVLKSSQVYRDKNSQESVVWESKNQESGTVERSTEIELEPVVIKLNKGMDPTPIPSFPPNIVSGVQKDKWKQDGVFRAD